MVATGWSQVYAVAAAREGVVTVADGRRAGIPASTWNDTARRQGWSDLGGGVRLLPGLPLSRSARLWAAVLALGPTAVLSHHTALELHGMTRWPDPDDLVHVVVDHRCTREPSHGSRRHRSRRFEAADHTVVSGHPVTTVARTLVDVAGQFGRSQLEGMLLAARQRGAFDLLGQVRSQLDRRPRVRGAGRLRVAAAVLEDRAVDSVLEARTLEFLHANHLPRPLTQYPIRGSGHLVVVDFAFPDAGLVLECDGRAFHGEDAFERDRHRWNVIREAGWSILFVTWSRLHDRPAVLAAEIRRALT